MQAGEDEMDVAILERMALEGRDVKLAIVEQTATPHQIIGISRVEVQRHELLLNGHRVIIRLHRLAGNEVIGLFVGREITLNESGRNRTYIHLHDHIIGLPLRLRVAGSERYY